VQLTLPRVGPVEDFHLQESAPCRAHKKRPAYLPPAESLVSYLPGGLAALHLRVFYHGERP